MRILVLAEDYSDLKGKVALHYIHSRNLKYVQNGIAVDVISFRANESYILDGVKVFTFHDYKKYLTSVNYDLLVSHAPNLKNHLRFIYFYRKRFDKIIFFFHGHEVLDTTKLYPEPYDYMNEQRKIKEFVKSSYDFCKLKIWKKFVEKNIDNIHLVFVSEWMFREFIKHTKSDFNIINPKSHVIYNGIGQLFEKNKYDKSSKKIYDFLTVRNNLDGSKYAIDIVLNLAVLNPKLKFCVVGKGDFFKYNSMPENLEWINNNFGHAEIIEWLNKSRAALIPTRTDAQGVMACEMASFGIPVFTSDIEVCNEIFEEFQNVDLISNTVLTDDLESRLNSLEFRTNGIINEKYYSSKTISKEIELFNQILQESN